MAIEFSDFIQPNVCSRKLDGGSICKHFSILLRAVPLPQNIIALKYLKRPWDCQD